MSQNELHKALSDLIKRTSGRCTNEDAGRWCMGFMVRHGDELLRLIEPSSLDSFTDSLALEVAKRFTLDTEPQRRASLQCAVIDAIKRAHPPQAQAGAGDAEDRVDAALVAYHHAEHQWNKRNRDDRDEPRHRFAMRAAIAAIESKP